MKKIKDNLLDLISSIDTILGIFAMILIFPFIKKDLKKIIKSIFNKEP